MKRFLGPAHIVAIAVAIAGLIFGQPALAALGAIAWVGSVAVASMKESSSLRAGATSNKGRVLVRPLERLQSEIEQIVADNPSNPVVKVIGNEALEESTLLVKRASAVAEMLDAARSASFSLADAESDIAGLRARLDAGGTEDERSSYQVAIDSREHEIAHYKSILSSAEASKTKLAEAEAALAAVKAKLAAAVAGGKSDDLDEDSLGGMVGRLKSLSTSLDETDELKERL